jgi:hypothetical protein
MIQGGWGFPGPQRCTSMCVPWQPRAALANRWSSRGPPPARRHASFAFAAGAVARAARANRPPLSRRARGRRRGRRNPPSGGYGEVYLSRWHSTEVAVKCLNPQLLTPDGDMGSVSRVRAPAAPPGGGACCAGRGGGGVARAVRVGAPGRGGRRASPLAGGVAGAQAQPRVRARASGFGGGAVTAAASVTSRAAPRRAAQHQPATCIRRAATATPPLPPRPRQDSVAELLKEANTLAALRHPNIVWVFGLVLPEATAEDRAAARAGSGAGAGGGHRDAVGLATVLANRWAGRAERQCAGLTICGPPCERE